MNDVTQVPRLRFGLLLWAFGMLGVIAITVTVLPQLAQLPGVPLPSAPLWVLSLASIAQSAVLLGIAVWLGVALAPALGFRAVVFESVFVGQTIARAVRSQLAPGLIGGIAGGILLFAVAHYLPSALEATAEQFNIPILARVLYGGITEELLLRWGVMTALVWLMWRFPQRRRGVPRGEYVWLAICISALLFGAGHLPMASMLMDELSGSIVAYVIGANAAFGLLFGFLFWRHGLESAMIAHATAHLVAYAGGHL